MKVLYHVATDAQGAPLTAVFIDGNGKRYNIPAFEATEFESDFMADKIMEHCHYYGIVEVMVTKTKTGRSYDVDEAEIRATEALLLSEKTCINDYLSSQLEWRVAENKPPLPPKGRQLDCVIKHKFNLLRAGIRPVGWEPPYPMDDPELDAPKKKGYRPAGIDADARMKQLETENAEIKGKLDDLIRGIALQNATGPKTGTVRVGTKAQQSTEQTTG